MVERKTLAGKVILKSQEIRDFLFSPILRLLTYFGISANFLSNFKIITFLPYLFLASYNIKAAFIFFLLSVLVDLFDGPLARFQKKQSDKGKFIDIFGDHLIYLLLILSLFYLNLANKDILVYHLFIFPLTMILATIKKQEFTKTDWIIKVSPELGYITLIFVIFLILFIYLNINYLNLVLFLTNLYYSFLVIYYFIFIQFRWLKLEKK